MAEKNKKRNWFIVAGITIAILVGLFMLARVTKVLEMYRVRTTSSEPALKKDALIWTSSLQPVSRGRHVTYLTFDSFQQRVTTQVHRCVGMPGDNL
ncbi:MAG: S26 family signal peptidase [Chitinophagaceae bacterium]